MKKAMTMNVLAICLFFVLTGFGFAEAPVRLASGEWAPYQSKNLKHAGLASRIVTEAFALEGIQTEFGYFPWKRSFFLARTGEWDGTFIWFDTPERRALFYVSDPILDIKYVFFHKKEFAFDWEHINDLRSLRIGGTIQYDYGAAFQSAEKEGAINVVRKLSDADNFLRLHKGQIHIFPCEVEVGYALLHKHFSAAEIQGFTHHPLPLKAAPHHLLLSKKKPRNERLILLFNRGLQRLNASGQVERYIAESRRGDSR